MKSISNKNAMLFYLLPLSLSVSVVISKRTERITICDLLE